MNNSSDVLSVTETKYTQWAPLWTLDIKSDNTALLKLSLLMPSFMNKKDKFVSVECSLLGKNYKNVKFDITKNNNKNNKNTNNICKWSFEFEFELDSTNSKLASAFSDDDGKYSLLNEKDCLDYDEWNNMLNYQNRSHNSEGFTFNVQFKIDEIDASGYDWCWYHFSQINNTFKIIGNNCNDSSKYFDEYDLSFHKKDQQIRSWNGDVWNDSQSQLYKNRFFSIINGNNKDSNVFEINYSPKNIFIDSNTIKSYSKHINDVYKRFNNFKLWKQDAFKLRNKSFSGVNSEFVKYDRYRYDTCLLNSLNKNDNNTNNTSLKRISNEWMNDSDKIIDNSNNKDSSGIYWVLNMDIFLNDLKFKQLNWQWCFDFENQCNKCGFYDSRQCLCNYTNWQGRDAIYRGATIRGTPIYGKAILLENRSFVDNFDKQFLQKEYNNDKTLNRMKNKRLHKSHKLKYSNTKQVKKSSENRFESNFSKSRKYKFDYLRQV